MKKNPIVIHPISEEKSGFLGFNDSLSEEEALRRAMAISLEDSMSSSAASEAGEGGAALSRMTEEEQLRKAIEDSLKSATAAEEEEEMESGPDGLTETPDKRLASSSPPSSSLSKKPRLEKGQEESAENAASAAAALGAIQINPDHEYRLTGVVSHLGDRANAGHYVADVCTRRGWRRYNDTLIRDGRTPFSDAVKFTTLT